MSSNSNFHTCRYATPFGLTSEYAHPAEILFLGFATFFGPAITGPHLFTLWIWMILRVLETVEAHSGYDFPWSISKFFPLYGGYVQLVLKASVNHMFTIKVLPFLASVF
jgi:sterol desaturase/sphingolipid hydroxylase (fatty acid hydroxylase superfamily)